MGEAYRGLTIRFQADGSKVLTTLRTMKRAANDVESELRQVKRALKFDGSSTRAAQRQLQLLAERAALAGAKAERIKRELKDLGHVEFGGQKMKELAEKTRDASTQASLMKARYNGATESLARLHNQMESAWASNKKLSAMPNPFENWEHMPTEGIQRAISIMEQFGAVTKEESARARSAVASLRAEWNIASAEFEKAKAIAGYKSFSNNLVKESAKAKAAAREMNAAAKAFRETGFEGKLAESRIEAERLEAQARKLKQAMRLDPAGFEATAAYAVTLKAHMRALESESEDLRAEMRALAKEPGIKELAADAVRLSSGMRNARAGVDSLGEQLVSAQAKAKTLAERVDELRIKMHEAGNTEAGREIRAQFESAEAELKQVNAQVDRLSDNYRQAEENVQRFNRAARYSDASTGIMANNAAVAGMNEQLKQNKKFRLLSSSAATSLGMSMYSTLYPAVMMGGSYAIQAADDVDSAYRDMRKTVQGTEEDFENLKKAALEFGDTHYTSADTMLEIEALGGQLGIQVDNLGQFAKVVSDLSIATDDAFDAESISLWLGKMANIMHLNVEEYDNFADSLVRLGNSEPALESDIANITSRFAGMASIVGMTPDEILAVATAATATGQKAEAAGGSLMRTLGRIESATSGVSEGMRNLEDMTDEDIEEFNKAKDSLQDYADVAGMTAEQFAKSWQNAPTETFQKFVDGLKRIKDEGGSVEHTLKDVLGIGSIRDRQLLNGLTQTTDVMADSLTMSKNAFNGVSDEWGDAGDAAREAEKKCQGFSGALQELKNNGQHLASIMGESLVPIIQDITGAVSTLVGWFAKLDPSVQQAITTSILASAALGPMLTMYGAGSSALKSMGASWREYTSAGNSAARMEKSVIMNGLGMTDNYKRYNKQLEGTRSSLEKVRQAQERHIANLGYESAALASQEKKLASNLSKQERAAGVMRNLSGALGVAKGLGAMAGLGVGLAVVEEIASELMEAKRRADEFTAATQGMSDAADKMRGSWSDIAGDMKSPFEDSTYVMGDYSRAVSELTSKQAALAQSYNETIDSAASNAQLAQIYADKISELAGNCEGSASKVEMLKNAVEQYNGLTGSNYSVVDDLTGRISAQTEELEANTKAYQDNVMAKAFADVAAQSAGNVAELTVKLEQNKREMEANAASLAQLEQEGRMYETVLDPICGAYETMSGEYSDMLNKYRDSVNANQELTQELDAAKKMAETAADVQAQYAQTAQDSARALEGTAASAKKYSKALTDSGASKGTFSSIAADAGYAKDRLDEFAQALSQSGISAQSLAATGAEAFSRLYQEANGDLALVNSALNVINDFSIAPKNVSISETGAVEVEGHIIDLQNRTIDDKSFTVTSDGTIDATDGEARNLLEELGILGAKVATPTANLNDQASGGISAVSSRLSSLDGSSATVSVYENTYKTTYNRTVNQGETHQATGGINMSLLRRVPRHASGAVMSGIARRAVLTSQGIVGEDGAEAILNMGNRSAVVPLSNKRYVRPFARAVAAEMGGAGQVQVVNNYYSLNGLTVQSGSREANALEVLAEAISTERRS